MSPYLIGIFVILMVMVLIMVAWIAYCLVPCYQQTITAKSHFQNTYRYIPKFNTEKSYKLDSIKVTITGTLKKEQKHGLTILPASVVERLTEETIISSYRNCLLAHEADSFKINEYLLNGDIKRCPLNKIPTLENISVIFFDKLSPVLLKNGCQLVNITLYSDNCKFNYYRNKYKF
jgi:hypothetical protein